MTPGLKSSEFIGPAGLIAYLLADGHLEEAVTIALVWAPAFAIGRAAVKCAEVIYGPKAVAERAARPLVTGIEREGEDV